MTTIAIFAFLYLLGMPAILQGACYTHKRLVVQRAAEKNRRPKPGQELPKPLMPKIRERMAFTAKDKRNVVAGKNTLGITNQQLMFALYAAGLAMFILAPVTGMWLLVLPGMLSFVLFVTFGTKASKDVIETRKTVIRKMFEIGRQRLGISSEYASNPGKVIKILEWRDLVQPQRAEFMVPTTFDESGQEGFLRQFNQVFGRETAWVPSDSPETGEPGWDYEKGKVTIHAVPPLPRMAPWKSFYVEHPGIAWSFFPIALGVENGVEMTDPDTGEKVNVLGFDVSGLQVEQGKKHGLKVSPTITTSPMVLVAGGTGSGKSIAAHTLVKVIKKGGAGAPGEPKGAKKP